MDKHEKIRTDVGSRHTGAKIPVEKREEIERRLKEGEGIRHIAKEVGSSEHTVTAIRNSTESGPNLNSWKKSVANNLMEFVAKGAERLNAEVDNIPIGSLPLAIAIAQDKALTLNDQPTHVTEHRLSISHDDIGRLIKGDIIDIDPPKIG
jgi:hypothetical protein